MKTIKDEYKQEIVKYENNQKTLTDSVITEYNKKLEQNVSSKTSYMISTIDELKKYNENLFKEMNSVKNTVASLNSKIKVSGLTGDVDNTVSKIDTNLYGLSWNLNHSDSGFKQTLDGISKFRLIDGNIFGDKTSITKNEFEIKLSYGFQDLGDTYKVWATSPSPLIKFSEINGAMLINKEKQKKVSSFSFGPSLLFGINSDIKGGGMRFGWSVGFGATYNIFKK